MTSLPQSASSIDAEKSFLAGLLCGACLEFTDLTPEDFFFPLHKRLYARLRMMNAMDEATNITAVVDQMTLDEQEHAAVAALLDPLHGPFAVKDMQAYSRIIK